MHILFKSKTCGFKIAHGIIILLSDTPSAQKHLESHCAGMSCTDCKLGGATRPCRRGPSSGAAGTQHVWNQLPLMNMI